MTDTVATREAVCNMALAHIAAESIMSFSENSAEAEQCRVFYDVSLYRTLAMFDWKFASERVTLVRVDADATAMDKDGWAFIYAKPPRCVKVRELLASNQVAGSAAYGFGQAQGSALGRVNDGTNAVTPSHTYTLSGERGFNDSNLPAVPFAMSNYNGVECIFADVDEARCRFTRLPEFGSGMPADFALMFSYILANLIAYPITRKFELVKWTEQMAAGELLRISSIYSNEAPSIRRDPPAPWVLGRGGY